IKQSYFVHKHKGTIGAVKRVVEPIGYLIELKEWFQTNPQGTPGTFSLTVEVSESGLNEQTYNELVRLINDVKPVSRHLNQLAIALSPTGSLSAFVGQQWGEIITVYPQ
ncbi:phage tail protein I, partial [Haemophilus influenzae]